MLTTPAADDAPLGYNPPIPSAPRGPPRELLMGVTASIFFDINLPNPTTWFYFSGLLAVALFFKFSRLLSVRNLDLLTLYLFAPGLLLLAEGQRWIRGGYLDAGREQEFFGYLSLMGACFYFLIRCLADLAIVRRPVLEPNLNLAGLAWLAGALYVSLIAIAFRQDARPEQPEAPARNASPAGKLPLIVERQIERSAPGVEDSKVRLAAERGLALACQLSVAVGLALIGWRHFDSLASGMACATFYLLLPYTFLLLPDSDVGVGRWDHAWPMAWVIWAIFTYRRPMLAGAFLGVAAGTAFFLLALLPAWLSFYRGRGAGRFLVSFIVSAGVGLAVLGGVLWLYGELPPSLQSAWTTFDWQPWKRPAAETPGFWQNIPSERVAYMPAAYRVPIFLGSMVVVLLAGFWPSPKDLAHVLALSAAALISIQFWYADRGGTYVLWFLPLLLLLTFRPNLSASEPPAVGEDWVSRAVRAVGGRLRRLWRRAAPQGAGKAP